MTHHHIIIALSIYTSTPFGLFTSVAHKGIFGLFTSIVFRVEACEDGVKMVWGIKMSEAST